MLQIVLCDDNPRHNQTLRHHIEQLIPDLPMRCAIALVTESPADVIAYAQSSHELTLYLLDLVLEEQDMNGLDVCNRIHEVDPRAYIIYVSAYAEYAMDCCRSHSFDFILKPYTVNRLENALLDVMQHITRNQSTLPLSVSVGSLTRVLDQQEIIYLKTQREYVTAYWVGGQFTWRESLTKLMDRLDSGWFIRIHKSYAVNRMHMKRIDSHSGEITLTGDIVLPVSRRVIRRLLQQGKEHSPSA